MIRGPLNLLSAGLLALLVSSVAFPADSVGASEDVTVLKVPA